MRLKTTAVCSILITAMAWGGAASAADDREDGSDEIAKALERDLGLTRDQVEEQGPLQERAIRLDARLQRALGDAYAGAWYDLDSGRLVVNVTDEGALEKAQGSGADARLVAHSLRELTAVKDALDAAAGAPTGGAERAASDKPIDIGLSAWSIDPITNTVLVTVTAEQADAAKQTVAEYGELVTIAEAPSAPETTADFMDGGDAINGALCSAGFNLRNPATGARFLLTAGHCVSAGSTLTGQGGVTFGTVLESWFPTFDDAIIRNQNTGYWIQGPWFDSNPSNGPFNSFSGWTDAPVGTIVCKAGKTTKFTCGTITIKNEDVTYSSGDTVNNMTRHSACVQPGDSGGSNLSWIGGKFRAEGVTSGARMRVKDGKKRCLSVFGEQNVSWYFPIADSLPYYGAKYGVTLW